MSLVDIHIHNEIPPELTEELHQIRLVLRRLEEKAGKIMATGAEVLQLLADANAATNEIADDLQELIDRIANTPEVPEDVKTSLADLVTKLQGVAAVVPEVVEPEPPTPPV